MYPPLGKDHQVFGKDFCSGFVDKDGNWNNGFYCPPISPDTSSVFCCGDSVYKYCCTQGIIPSFGGPSLTPHITDDGEIDLAKDYDLSTHTPPTITTTMIIGAENNGGELKIEVDIARNSTVAAMICGLVAITVLMTLVACFYCKCCLLYKKRRSQLQLGGLYRIPTSSTNCGLMNSSSSTTNPATTPSSSFNHSHNSAFVATAIPIPILDSWSVTGNPTAASVPAPQAGLLPNQGGRHQQHFHPPQPNLLLNNVTSHNQAQILNGLLSHGGIPRPTHLTFPSRNSLENSSSSSISTISSCTPTTRPQPQSTSIPSSRTNSIPPSSIALRLQRQLLQTHYRYQNQHQQNNQNSNRSNNNSNANNNHHAHHHHQQSYNYSRNGNVSRPIMSSGSNSAEIPPIYTVGRSSSSHHPSAMSSLLSSVNFSPGSNSSSHNSLPPPYFLEQYRIRNRIRVPRNPPLPQSNLPSYTDIQQQQQQLRETSSSHNHPSDDRSNRRNNDTHFLTLQQPLPSSQSHQQQPLRQQATSSTNNNNNSLRRPNHQPVVNLKSPNQASPTIGVIPVSPLNDLSAPSQGRRPGRSCSKGTLGTEGNNEPGSAPSRHISRQITEQTSNVFTLGTTTPTSTRPTGGNVCSPEYDPSDKILNTTPISFLQNSPLRSSSDIIKRDSSLCLLTETTTRAGESACKSQSLENVNVTSSSAMLQKNSECTSNNITTGGADI